jgi:hypothetical protein
VKRFFWVILLFVFTQACTSPVDPAPADVLSPRKMTGIMVDIHVAESRIETMGLVTDTAAVYFKNMQDEIFKKHQITEEQFYKSYDYYLNNVSELDKIYEKVVDSLSVTEVEATQTQKIP